MDATTKAIAERANELVGRLISADHVLATLNAELDERIAAIKQELGPELEEWTQERSLLETELKELLDWHFNKLIKPSTKTIYLRNGAISKRLGPEKMVISDDEATIIRRIRQARGVKRFIRRGKETLDKVALRKDPAFVARIKGLAIVQDETLVIKPSSAQGEIILAPNAIKVSKPSQDNQAKTDGTSGED